MICLSNLLQRIQRLSLEHDRIYSDFVSRLLSTFYYPITPHFIGKSSTQKSGHSCDWREIRDSNLNWISTADQFHFKNLVYSALGMQIQADADREHLHVSLSVELSGDLLNDDTLSTKIQCERLSARESSSPASYLNRGITKERALFFQSRAMYLLTETLKSKANVEFLNRLRLHVEREWKQAGDGNNPLRCVSAFLVMLMFYHPVIEDRAVWAIRMDRVMEKMSNQSLSERIDIGMVVSSIFLLQQQVSEHACMTRSVLDDLCCALLNWYGNQKRHENGKLLY